MTVYLFSRLLKFIGVSLYAGGLVGSSLASTTSAKRRAVHGIASPGLLIAWIAGYLLTLQTQVPLSELWIVAGLALSFLSQLALVRSVSRNPPSRDGLIWAALLFAGVLALMVFRPTWSSVQ